MEYFRLAYSLSDGPVCKNWDFGEFDRKRLLLGEKINDWPNDATCHLATTPTEDYLANTIYVPVMSAKMFQSLQGAGIQRLQFLPIKMVIQEAQLDCPDYYVVNVLTRVQALDLDNSVVDKSVVRGQEVITGVRKYVIRRSAMVGHDVVRLAEYRHTVLISERVRYALEGAGITGCDFFHVKLI